MKILIGPPEVNEISFSARESFILIIPVAIVWRLLVSMISGFG